MARNKTKIIIDLGNKSKLKTVIFQGWMPMEKLGVGDGVRVRVT